MPPCDGTRSRAEPPSGVRRPCPVQRLGWPMRSGASGVARLDAFPHVWRGRDALPRGAAVRRPTAVSRAAPWMVDALRRVRRCMAFPHVWRGSGRDALPRGAVVRRPTAVSRPALWMVDALRRVRRCTSRPAICRFVFGPFHYCAFCERAAPDAPETIHDQRRCTGCRDRTIYGGSRGSASLPNQGLEALPCLRSSKRLRSELFGEFNQKNRRRAD